jgi:molybdopterin synthase sulfur carrier subunit
LKIIVRAFAQFRELLGGEQFIPVPQAETVRGLLERLGDDNPAFSSRALQNDGNLMPAVIILLNGRNIQSLDGLESRLNEGDVVAIFSPIAGG